MDSRVLRDAISRSFSATLNIELPADDVDLFEAGILDSLAFVELLLLLEQQFGVTTNVEDLEIENFRTIARIAGFVAERSASGRARVVSIGSRR